MRNRQRGITTVEFAIVGALLMMMLFGVIEFGRALFVANALVEGTRRGARIAAVCPIDDPLVRRRPPSCHGERRQPDCTRSHHDATSSSPISMRPARWSPTRRELHDDSVRAGAHRELHTATADSIRRSRSITMPDFAATLPRESLGYAPTAQAFVRLLILEQHQSAQDPSGDVARRSAR